MTSASTIRTDGALTLWSLAEYSRQEPLALDLEALGFKSQAPKPMSPMTALKLALAEVCGRGRSVEVKPLKGKDGYCVVEGKRQDYKPGDQWGQVSLVVKVDNSVQGQMQLTFDPLDDRAQKVVSSYNQHLGLVHREAVSNSLIEIAKSLKATCPRPGGGLYWLPEQALASWAAVSHAIERHAQSGSSSVYLVRHAFDADSLRTVKDAIVREAMTELDRLKAEVADESLGERALGARKQQALDLEAKIREYEGILSMDLGTLRSAAEETADAAAKAALLAAVSEEVAA